MTLLSPPDRPARIRTPGRPAPVRRRRGLLAAACAGLLTACASQAGHLHAAGHGARAAAGQRARRTRRRPWCRRPRPRRAPRAPGAAGRPSRRRPTGPAAGPPRRAARRRPAAQPAAAGAVRRPAALQVSVGGANGAAGSIYYPLDFTNISGAPCTMYGYPGVSFVSAAGRRRSSAGRRSATPPSGPALVTLAPGAVAHASVQVVVAQNYPARCASRSPRTGCGSTRRASTPRCTPA